MVVQRDCGAHHKGNDGVQHAIVDTATNIRALQNSQAVFGECHAPGLPVADQHIYLDFQPPQALQSFALEVIGRNGYNHRARKRRGPWVVCLFFFVLNPGSRQMYTSCPFVISIAATDP